MRYIESLRRKTTPACFWGIKWKTHALIFLSRLTAGTYAVFNNGCIHYTFIRKQTLFHFFFLLFFFSIVAFCIIFSVLSYKIPTLKPEFWSKCLWKYSITPHIRTYWFPDFRDLNNPVWSWITSWKETSTQLSTNY